MEGTPAEIDMLSLGAFVSPFLSSFSESIQCALIALTLCPLWAHGVLSPARGIAWNNFG